MTDSHHSNRPLSTRVKTAKGRKIGSTRWLQRQLNDPYIHKAHQHGYRSRSAFKLLELQEKLNFLRRNMNVVDLGCAPGGWLQVVQSVVKEGKIIGLDLQAVTPMDQVTLLQTDFMQQEGLELVCTALEDQKVDIVLSDMAAASCGHRQTDHLRNMALCEAALDFAIEHLALQGTFICKILKGGQEHHLLTQAKHCFSHVKYYKPASSRQDSSESFLVAMNFGAHIV